ncbi:hypothetical protein C0Q70_20949 [Pomacea canaliculata]|uniref:Uncharacterized protein n=1 Tax=Pomacea canaliculata TaxID=400727 RepID=A0A2T7NB45_POMCA|nr:hypothetical protein C0Q70_20949 [Pomacea canaliculata]
MQKSLLVRLAFGVHGADVVTATTASTDVAVTSTLLVLSLNIQVSGVTRSTGVTTIPTTESTGVAIPATGVAAELTRVAIVYRWRHPRSFARCRLRIPASAVSSPFPPYPHVSVVVVDTDGGGGDDCGRWARVRQAAGGSGNDSSSSGGGRRRGGIGGCGCTGAGSGGGGGGGGGYTMRGREGSGAPGDPGTCGGRCCRCPSAARAAASILRRWKPTIFGYAMLASLLAAQFLPPRYRASQEHKGDTPLPPPPRRQSQVASGGGFNGDGVISGGGDTASSGSGVGGSLEVGGGLEQGSKGKLSEQKKVPGLRQGSCKPFNITDLLLLSTTPTSSSTSSDYDNGGSGQCYPLNTWLVDQVCSCHSAHRLEALMSARLNFCSILPAFSCASTSPQAPPLAGAAPPCTPLRNVTGQEGAGCTCPILTSEASCKDYLRTLVDLDREAQQRFQDFKDILRRYDCNATYSVKWTCTQCESSQTVCV